MKIGKLRATGVHGYLDLEINFHRELTFLVGLNGSGKTSALNLLMGLLSPSFEQLSRTAFQHASVEVEIDAATKVLISAETSAEMGVALSVGGCAEQLIVKPVELEVLRTSDPHEEPRQPIVERIEQHEVVQRIQQLSTPMYLALDRRFGGAEPEMDLLAAHRRRHMVSRHLASYSPLERGSSFSHSLFDAVMLIEERYGEFTARRSSLESELRDDIVTASFSYTSGPPESLFAPPDPLKLRAIKEKQQAIKDASESLGLERIQDALLSFYDRMTEVTSQMESVLYKKNIEEKNSPEGSSSEPGVDSGADEAQERASRAIVEWFVNQTQVDRVYRLVQLLEEYSNRRKQLFEPLERFVTVVNMFYKETGKAVSLNGRGYPEVSVNSATRPVSALSSGERQILVMMAHLSLNERLQESGVFIVDEPELSLHISWQEQFVDAVRQANPSAQLILATHSPAIVLDRGNLCVDVSGAGGRGEANAPVA